MNTTNTRAKSSTLHPPGARHNKKGSKFDMNFDFDENLEEEDDDDDDDEEGDDIHSQFFSQMMILMLRVLEQVQPTKASTACPTIKTTPTQITETASAFLMIERVQMAIQEVLQG